MAAIRAMVDRLASGGPALAAPTDLRLVNATDTALQMAWAPVAGATTYTLRLDGAVAALGVPSPSYTLTGLASGTAYVITVQAVAGAATSAPSAPITARTTGTPPPLAAPSGVRVTATTADSVALAWNAVAGAASYVAVRDGGAMQLNTTALGVTDTGLRAETAYTYTVRAADATGALGPASAAVVATTRSAYVCTETEDSNYGHVAAGRAYAALGYAYAVGSDDYMGLYNTFYRTRLAETASGYYIVGACP
jgi:chitodextrinase